MVPPLELLLVSQDVETLRLDHNVVRVLCHVKRHNHASWVFVLEATAAWLAIDETASLHVLMGVCMIAMVAMVTALCSVTVTLFWLFTLLGFD